MAVRDYRHQVRITEDETRYLDELQARHDFSSRSDAIRYCIQRVIEIEGLAGDEQAIREHLDETRAITKLYGMASFVTITELFSVLLELLNEDENTDITRPDNMRRELYQTIFEEAGKIESIFDKMHRQIKHNRSKSPEKQPAK